MRGRAGSALDPAAVFLDVSAFDRRPGDHVRALLAVALAGELAIGVVERLAVDVLRVVGQMAAHRRRQIGIVAVGHCTLAYSQISRRRTRRTSASVGARVAPSRRNDLRLNQSAAIRSAHGREFAMPNLRSPAGYSSRPGAALPRTPNSSDFTPKAAI